MVSATTVSYELAILWSDILLLYTNIIQDVSGRQEDLTNEIILVLINILYFYVSYYAINSNADFNVFLKMSM